MFLHWLLERMEKGESIKEYCNIEKPQQLEPTLKLFAAIENNQQKDILEHMLLQGVKIEQECVAIEIS